MTTLRHVVVQALEYVACGYVRQPICRRSNDTFPSPDRDDWDGLFPEKANDSTSTHP